MTQLEKRSNELAELLFPDANNIWARPNIEKESVASQMVFLGKEIIEKACEAYEERHRFLNDDEKNWEIALFRQSIEGKL